MFFWSMLVMFWSLDSMTDEIVFLLEGNIHFKGAIQTLKSDTKQHDLEHAIAVLLEKNHV